LSRLAGQDDQQGRLGRMSSELSAPDVAQPSDTNYMCTPNNIPQIVGPGNDIDNTVCALQNRKPYPDHPWKAKHRPKSGSKPQFGQVNQRKL